MGNTVEGFFITGNHAQTHKLTTHTHKKSHMKWNAYLKSRARHASIWVIFYRKRGTHSLCPAEQMAKHFWNFISF